MLNSIAKLVEDACKSEKNFFGYAAWTHHIVFVVYYSKILAEKLNADKEVVEIAALLHDYAGILNYEKYPEHHIYGAKIAEEILTGYNYPKDKLEQVKHCIYSHRGSKDIPRETLEAQIITDADSMAHFDLKSMLHLAYCVHKLDVEEGADWALAKLERSWNKLTLPEAKELVADKYAAIMKALKKENYDKI